MNYPIHDSKENNVHITNRCIVQVCGKISPKSHKSGMHARLLHPPDVIKDPTLLSTVCCLHTLSNPIPLTIVFCSLFLLLRQSLMFAEPFPVHPNGETQRHDGAKITTVKYRDWSKSRIVSAANAVYVKGLFCTSSAKTRHKLFSPLA